MRSGRIQREPGKNHGQAPSKIEESQPRQATCQQQGPPAEAQGHSHLRLAVGSESAQKQSDRLPAAVRNRASPLPRSCYALYRFAETASRLAGRRMPSLGSCRLEPGGLESRAPQSPCRTHRRVGQLARRVFASERQRPDPRSGRNRLQPRRRRPGGDSPLQSRSATRWSS